MANKNEEQPTEKDIEEAAKLLGIPANEKLVYHDFILDFLNCPLPSNIRSLKTNENKIYYIDLETKDVLMENPNLTDFRKKYDKLQTKPKSPAKGKPFSTKEIEETVTFRSKTEDEFGKENPSEKDEEKMKKSQLMLKYNKELQELEKNEFNIQTKKLEELRKLFEKTIKNERERRLQKRKELLSDQIEMKKREYEAHYKGILDDKKSELLKESENFLIEYEKARRAEIDAQIFEYEQNLRMQTIAPLKNRIHFLKMELEKGLLQENYHKELEIHDLNMRVSDERNNKNLNFKKSKVITPNYETILDMENLQNHLIKKEKRKEALDLELQKIKKENKGLNLELLSLNNKLSIFSEKSLKRKQKEQEISHLFKTLSEFENDRTLSKYDQERLLENNDETAIIKHHSRSYLNQDSFSASYNLHENQKTKKIEDNRPPETTFLFKKTKSSRRNNSLNYSNNEVNFLTDSPSSDDRENFSLSFKNTKKNCKTNKIESLKPKIFGLQAKQQKDKGQNDCDLQKDWVSVLMLEKEKIRLLTENLQNEKIIAKNKQQRLLSEFRSFKKKSKYHFNPLSENEISPAINLEAWYDLNQEMKFLARKEIFIRKAGIMLNELRDKIDSTKNNFLIQSQYMEFISKTKNEKELIEAPDLNIESFSLSDLTANDDIEFYTNWKKLFDEFLKAQIVINEEQYEENSEKENISENAILDRRFENSVNMSRQEIQNKLNQTLNLEERNELKNYKNPVNTYILMNKYSKERENIGNELNKHSKWLSNLKTQLSSEYFFKPYDDLIKKYSTLK